MRILFCSHAFAPSVGGIETVGAILAEQFVRLGSEVTVVTDTPGTQKSTAYQIVRRPSLRILREMARSSDIVFQNNISLKTLLPVLTCGKPIVVAHHGELRRVSGKRGWQDYLKLAVVRVCHNIAISEAIAATLPVKSVVVGNPYETGEFGNLEQGPRSKDLVFMGRLVSQKGCDLLLRALSILKNEGTNPSLTVIGDGPEMSALKRLSDQIGVSSQVTFKGSIQEGRGRELAEHKIIVIPSRYAEPFGVVALEGIAAGCVVIASAEGGLPEAVGSCGVLFPMGDAKALASALKGLLSDQTMREKLMSHRTSHLERFRPEIVASKYMEVFNSARRK